MEITECYKLIYLARRAVSVSREDWPRTWRSHAVFASQLPDLEAQLEWVRYCNRIDTPTIDGEAVILPQLDTDHDGVAVVASATFEGIKGKRFTPEIQAKIDEDELRVFDMLTPNFSFFTKETVVKEGPLGNAALFLFLPRGEGVSPEDFKRRYCTEHLDVATRVTKSIPGLRRSVLNAPIHDPLPMFPFGVISEYWFDTPDEASVALRDGTFDEIFTDLDDFCEISGIIQILTSTIHKWSTL